MSGFNYTIDFRLGGMNALSQAVKVTSVLDGNVNRLTVDLGKTGNAFDQAGKKGKSAFDSMIGGVAGLITRLGLADGAMKALDNTANQSSFESSINFASGSAQEGAKNLGFFKNTVDQLGLPLQASQEGFKTLMGSVMGTNITMDQARSTFTGVASASTVLGMRSEQTELAMKALGQIASKGKVSMEELRGQLGDHLPGAMNIAARAMGVSQAKFQDMVKDGIEAEVFLPRFAAELNKTFGAGALDAANGPRAQFNRLKTSLFELSVTVGNQLMPVALGLIQNFLVPAAHWIGQNIDLIGFLAVSAGSAYLAFKAWTIGQKIWSAVMLGSKFATALMTGSVWQLTAAMYANPVGLLVAGVVGLAAGVIWAWNKFEGFRGFIVGAFFGALEHLKGLAMTLIMPWKVLGRVIGGIFTGDWKAVKEGLKKDVSYISDSGSRAAKAYQSGWNKAKGMTLSNPLASKKSNALDGALGAAAGGPGGAGAAAAAGGGGMGSTGSSVAEGITGDGKSKSITINIQKFFDQITIQTVNAGEGVDQLVDRVVRGLVQAVNTANQVQ